MRIEENIPLATLTTFKTGGPARFLLSLASEEEVPAAVSFAEEKKLPLIPLGAGSNMLAPDSGVDAVFVRLESAHISFHVENNRLLLTADAGALWDDVVSFSVEQGAGDIENLSAIPGTAGAAAMQNIGAYGAALSDVFVSAKAFDMHKKKWKTFFASECGFGYRTSIFKREADRYVIASVTLSLTTKPRPNLSYKDLAFRFQDRAPSLSEIREAVIEIRKEKFPPLSRYGTAGSFFLNPIMSMDESRLISQRFPNMPVFPLPEGGIKVPLAWILDQVLALKGRRIGNAFLWEQQALVIAAERGATSEEIISLAHSVSADVFEKTNIRIFPEVRILK